MREGGGGRGEGGFGIISKVKLKKMMNQIVFA
jgi:hypothetical protein